MSLLCDKDWKLKYTPDDGNLVTQFYVPALECAVRYDRLTMPARLKKAETKAVIEPTPELELPQPPPQPALDLRRLVWAYIKQAPKMPNGGERVGEATANVEPWPHQIRAFQRLYSHWPPRLLIADEVGLGKTIQAGLLIRQAWLAEKARRVLILTPASICRQWQVELREKFNLNWPMYDGDQLLWLASPGRAAPLEEPIARSETLACRPGLGYPTTRCAATWSRREEAPKRRICLPSARHGHARPHHDAPWLFRRAQ